MSDKDFIKKMIESDLKSIPNPDFTLDTVRKLKELKDQKSKLYRRQDFSILYPIFIYALIVAVILFSKAITSIIPFDQVAQFTAFVEHIINMVIINPLAVSITISISLALILLYLFDLYLKKAIVH